MTSTDTQGISDCDQAFEDHYKCSSRDPSNAGDLAIWRAAWARATPPAAKEEALSEEQIDNAIKAKAWSNDPHPIYPTSFAAGVRWAEQQHGIGDQP